MGQVTITDISAKMRGIDIAMLSTKTEGGEIASRPMSNNGDVEYDGASYYFTLDSTRTVSDVERDDKVSLAFAGKNREAGFYATVEGRAALIRDRAAFEKHWTPDLDVWFEKGADTPGLVLVRIDAERIKYWDGDEDGELVVLA